jgi:hypothetical protein
LAAAVRMLDHYEGRPLQRVVTVNADIEAARLSNEELEAELVRQERVLSRRPRSEGMRQDGIKRKRRANGLPVD